MGSNGGGGSSTTQAEHSPEMRALQQSALPEIRSMMQLNPLSNYAAWSPRQIAGSNPAYDMLFQQASQMGPALGGLNLIFGDSMQDGGGGMAVPNMGGGAGGAGTGVPLGGQGNTVAPPPPGFQPNNIQDIIRQQIEAQVNPAIQQAVATYQQPQTRQVETRGPAGNYETATLTDPVNNIWSSPSGWSYQDQGGMMVPWNNYWKGYVA